MPALLRFMLQRDRAVVALCLAAVVVLAWRWLAPHAGMEMEPDFAFLAAMPMNATSKVDRTALPRASRTRPELETPFALARTPLEERLAGVWAEVLGLDRVGIHDAFLELGGDSLLASRIVARVVDAFALDVPVRALLEAPTVAAMALLVLERGIESRHARLRPGDEPVPGGALA